VGRAELRRAPWDAGNRTPTGSSACGAALEANPRAGVGEIGLDRWLLELKPDDPRVAVYAWQTSRNRPRFSPRSWPLPRAPRPSSTRPVHPLRAGLGRAA